MFEAYTTTPTVYEENAPVVFTDTRFRDYRIMTSGSSTIRICAPGRYLVLFNGVGASNTAASPFTIALYKNDVAIPGIVSTITSTVAGDQQTLSLGTIINVPPSCCCSNNEVSLRLVVTSAVAGTLSSGSIKIFRLK